MKLITQLPLPPRFGMNGTVHLWCHVSVFHSSGGNMYCRFTPTAKWGYSGATDSYNLGHSSLIKMPYLEIDDIGWEQI